MFRYAEEMSLARTVAPAENFLTDQRVWDHLRVDLSGSPAEPDDKAMISLYRDGVQAHLDGWDGILGRAIVTQTWEMKLRSFPLRTDRIYGDVRMLIPLPPLQSVSSITYIDADGVTQTLASSEYTVIVGSNAVVPAYGKTWPGTRDVPEAVTVTFVAGYGTADDVPDGIVSAGLLMVGDSYDVRRTEYVGVSIQRSDRVMDILNPYIVRGFR